MKSTLSFFRLGLLMLPLIFLSHVAHSQRYYTPPGREEPMLLGTWQTDGGHDFYAPIQIGNIRGNYVYTDARHMDDYGYAYHYKAHGVWYKFTLTTRSTVVIDQMGSEPMMNMSINLIDPAWYEIRNDFNYMNMDQLPAEYLNHPYTIAGQESTWGWWEPIYKEELEPGDYYIASHGGYGNAGWHTGVVVTNLYVYSLEQGGGGFEFPNYFGNFNGGFTFTETEDVLGYYSVYGNPTPDIVYAFDIAKAMKLTATTSGSDFPGSYIYILDQYLTPVANQKVTPNPDGSVTVTINNLQPGMYYVVSEAGEYYGQLKTTIEGYVAPEPNEGNGPMPEEEPEKEILPEPSNNNPIRFQYDGTGNRTDRTIHLSWSGATNPHTPKS